VAKTQIKGLSKDKGDVGGRIVFPAGWYQFECKEADERQSKAGDPMYHAELEVKIAPEGAKEYVGRTYFSNMVVIADHENFEFMRSKVKNILNAGKIRVASDDTFNWKSLEGKTVWGNMAVSLDRRDGTQQSQVSRFEDADFDPDAAPKGKSRASEDDD